MRTTVTLDDDLVGTLQELARERKLSFKEVLNTTIRAGLKPAGQQPPPLPTRRLGLRPGVDLDKAQHLADDLEDAEIIRKLELRK